MTPIPTLGVYRATVVEVTDGDTIRISALLIPRYVADVVWYFRVRLARCNAREKKQPGGVEAKAYLTGFLPVGTELTVQLKGLDKYGGRLQGEFWKGDVNLSDYLIEQQWAAPWNGRGEPPVPPWPREVT